MKKKEMFAIVDTAFAVIDRESITGREITALKRLRDEMAPRRGSLLFLKVFNGDALASWDGPMKSASARDKSAWWERQGFTLERVQSTPSVESEVASWLTDRYGKGKSPAPPRPKNVEAESPQAADPPAPVRKVRRKTL